MKLILAIALCVVAFVYLGSMTKVANAAKPRPTPVPTTTPTVTPSFTPSPPGGVCDPSGEWCTGL